MSDLEQQRRAYDAWGRGDYVPRSPGGPGLQLTPEMRRLAEMRDGEADGLLAALNEGLTWFTAYRLKSMPHGLDALTAAGILTKHKSQEHDGHYYKRTAYTRPWCLTALALREERCKRLKERTEGSQGSG